MSHKSTLGPIAHPSPRRGRVSASALIFGSSGAPLAWAVHLVANYALASTICFPGNALRHQPASSMRWGWSLLVAIDLITMVIAVLAAIAAYRNWRLSHEEGSRSFGGLVEIGEGRTSFLSLWGILTSAGFSSRLRSISSDFGLFRYVDDLHYRWRDRDGLLRASFSSLRPYVGAQRRRVLAFRSRRDSGIRFGNDRLRLGLVEARHPANPQELQLPGRADRVRGNGGSRRSTVTRVDHERELLVRGDQRPAGKRSERRLVVDRGQAAGAGDRIRGSRALCPSWT